jgi:sugar lactone lactonase YvrE
MNGGSKTRVLVLAITFVVATSIVSAAAWAGRGAGRRAATRGPLTAADPADEIAASPPTWGKSERPGYWIMAFAPDGTLFATDCANARVYEVTSDGPKGTTQVVVGKGPGGLPHWERVKGYGWILVNSYGGDGRHPTDAYINCPVGLAFDEAGNMFIADHNNSRIREVSTDGFVSTLAGVGPGESDWGPWTDGIGPSAGDGGPAVHGLLDAPWGIAFDPEGNLFIADRDHDAVREVDTDGVLTTVAGTGVKGFNGDDRPATSAELDRPVDVAFDAAGDLFISDEDNRRIRRVDEDGTITTYAGTGEYGCEGDGGPAAEASFRNPSDIAFGPDGSLYVSDSECRRVRRIAPDGTVSTFARNTDEHPCRGIIGEPVDRFPVEGDVSFAFAPNGDMYLTGVCWDIIRVDGEGIMHLFAKAPDPGGYRG